MMAQWKQYSGMWTRQSQMQAAGAQTWPNLFIGTSLFGWAYNGIGSIGDGTVISRSSPVQVGSQKNWEKIFAGSDSSMAIKNDGSLWSWGYNAYGQLGQNNSINTSSPVQVGALTNWSVVCQGSDTSSNQFTLSIKTDGTLWSWGANSFGQLGQNIAYNVRRSSPVQVGSLSDWSNLGVGVPSFSVAIKTNGTLWSWGAQSYGQLGQGALINRSSPVQVGGLTDWASVATGRNHSVALKTNNTIWSWGRNNYGQLGDGTAQNKSSPVQIGALTTWLSTHCGYSFSFAIKNDNTLWAWGLNSYGQLGTNNTTYYYSPVQVGLLSNWKSVSGLEYTTVATKTDGTLWSWGGNPNGELGLNLAAGTYGAKRSSPVQVGSLTTWNSVSCSIRNVMALYDNYTPSS